MSITVEYTTDKKSQFTLPGFGRSIGRMKQKIWYSIIESETKYVEISVKVEISAKDFLWIISGSLGVLKDIIEIFISDRMILQSAVEEFQ